MQAFLHSLCNFRGDCNNHTIAKPLANTKKKKKKTVFGQGFQVGLGISEHGCMTVQHCTIDKQAWSARKAETLPCWYPIYMTWAASLLSCFRYSCLKRLCWCSRAGHMMGHNNVEGRSSASEAKVRSRSAERPHTRGVRIIVLNHLCFPQ